MTDQAPRAFRLYLMLTWMGEVQLFRQLPTLSIQTLVDTLCALEKLATKFEPLHGWVQACEVLPDKTLRLALGPDTDSACAELSALALLLVPRSAADAAPKRAGGRPPGLSVKTEVRHTTPSYFLMGRKFSFSFQRA